MVNILRNARDNFLIALIVWHICIVCTVIPEHFRPYKPVQIIHSQPVVLKDHARIALRWTCPEVRAFAAGKSKAELEQAAKSHGLTEKERAEALKCLKDRRERAT